MPTTYHAAKRALALNTLDEKQPISSFFKQAFIVVCTWLICTAETWAEHTDEWLGEFGRDLQGPIDSCCFFLVATIF